MSTVIVLAMSSNEAKLIEINRVLGGLEALAGEGATFSG
jgi:hypothetical protein